MIKKFDEFVKDGIDGNTDDIKDIDLKDMPTEFTGDPKTDPYLSAAIYKYGDEDHKIKLNFSYRESGKLPDEYNPYKKSQEEGNFYNKLWKQLVDWVKSRPDFKEKSVIDNDRRLLAAFRNAIDKQKSSTSLRDIKRQDWKADTFNMCKDKWERLVKVSKKMFPNDRDWFRRMDMVKDKYMEFAKEKKVEKYAKSWIPEFSRNYPVK